MSNQLEAKISNPDVVVIGGGLAGLAAAALVARAGKSVEVRERHGNVGGRARSINKNGFTFNQGPHALYRGGPAERVLTNLGVRIDGGIPPTKARMVFSGKAEVGPSGPWTLLRTKALSAREKMVVGRLLTRLPKINAAEHSAVSVEEWIASSVDSERPADMVRSLARLATYVNQPELLSADVAIGQLQAALSNGVFYLNGGWQSLVDQLRAHPGVSFNSGEAVTEIPDAPAVIVAVGGPGATSALTGQTYQVGREASASCLDLGLSQRPTHDVVLGGDVPFYFSNHSAVAELAPAGLHNAAAVQYLRDGEQPDDKALAAFPTFAGVRPEHIVASRRLHRMTTVTAIATATLNGLAGRPTTTDSGQPNVFIAGDWVGPVGHLADASLASAESAARGALRSIDRVLR